MTIPDAEIQRRVSFDPKGYLFTWNGELFRGIYPEREAEVRALFTCGLIDELTERRLLPPTEITDLTRDDAALVLRHERIPAVTLPAEWSFEMLRDAARTVLDVNVVARRHGHQTLDAHGFNVVFDRGRPLFTDVGSFVALRRDFGASAPGWKPYKEFLRCFHAPLVLWSRGEGFFARHALHGDQLPLALYWRHRHALLRLPPARWLEAFEYLFYNYKALNTIGLAEFEALADASPSLARLSGLVRWLAGRGRLPFSSVDLDRLRSRIDRIPAPRATGPTREPAPDAAGEALLKLLDEYAIETVVDVGGDGDLPGRILEHTGVKHVTWIHDDASAVDRLYRALREAPQPIQPVLKPFHQSIADEAFPSALERLRAEAVVALGCAGGWIRSQGLTPEFVVLRLRSWTRRYAFVDVEQAGGLEGLEAAFARHFRQLGTVEIAPGRRLLVGERAA